MEDCLQQCPVCNRSSLQCYLVMCPGSRPCPWRGAAVPRACTRHACHEERFLGVTPFPPRWTQKLAAPLGVLSQTHGVTTGAGHSAREVGQGLRTHPPNRNLVSQMEGLLGARSHLSATPQHVLRGPRLPRGWGSVKDFWALGSWDLAFKPTQLIC